jgi:hypothetical protein
MLIAHVTLPGRGATDACLARTVDILTARGLRLAGTVQTNRPRPGAGPCDMDVRVLPDGPTLCISQALGSGARGCRLDGGALEEAVVAVMPRIAGASLLVVNKFGKQEGMGRGLVPCIVEAMDRGIPVLVGVNGLNLQAFLDFAGGASRALRPDPGAVAGWALDAVLADA